MKTFIFLTALALFFSILPMQAQFAEAMKDNIKELENCKTADDFQNLANAFVRISEAEPKEWLSDYYAAFAMVNQTIFMNDNKQKDEILNAAMDIVNSAMNKSEKNSELLTLKSFIMQMQIAIDPMMRGMKLGAESDKLLSSAININPENPRPYLIRAESIFYTPAQFGGGKAKAKPILEISINKFSSFKPETELHPIWGLSEAEQLLQKCK